MSEPHQQPVSQDENAFLWALQQYQKVIRFWVRDLSLIEFAVLMQVLDRTVGWQKTTFTIGVPQILNGGRFYTGIGHTVKKSSVMAALRRLENKGIIVRRTSEYHPVYKEYFINLDWVPPQRTEPENANYDETDCVPSLYEQSLDGSI